MSSSGQLVATELVRLLEKLPSLELTSETLTFLRAGGADPKLNRSHEDLSGLPPAFITVAALDLFLEESLEYARSLIRAGVPTERSAEL